MRDTQFQEPVKGIDLKISVCIATFNGAMHISRQLISILDQIKINDEVIIVDDCSIDDTVQIINNINDKRIKLYINPANLGAVGTFDKALHLAQGDLIFLSDQDDIWFDNKVTLVSNFYLTQNIDLIVHDAIIVQGNEIVSKSLFKYCNSSSGILKNIISNTYTGCCMSFKREILAKALPIPNQRGLFHDAWIGIIAECFGFKTAFIEIPLIEWNRHGGNVSVIRRRGILTILTERILLLHSLLKRFLRS